MSKKNDQITELSYMVEAQDDEIEYLKNTIEELKYEAEELRDVLAQRGSRITELIEENDRLTLTYEPYYPPGRSFKEKLKDASEDKAGIVSFDFWPPQDWFRCNLNRWHPGQAFQAVFGPLRIDWFQN